MSDISKKVLINQGLGNNSPDHQTAEIKKMWRIFTVSEDSVLELRAIWPKGTATDPCAPRVFVFSATNFASLDAMKKAFERQALLLNAQGYNIYTVMNPISADFIGSGGVKDHDIRHRSHLLVDIDRMGDTRLPANQAEMDAAKVLADAIRAFMHERGWPKPVAVMSGNGYHLYFPLGDLPNNDDTTALVRLILKNLAAMFDTPQVGVDTSVSNASRITKVPGTIMRKGIATEDRPYRMAEVCDEQ
jgi:hypothetical protein